MSTTRNRSPSPTRSILLTAATSAFQPLSDAEVEQSLMEMLQHPNNNVRQDQVQHLTTSVAALHRAVAAVLDAQLAPYHAAATRIQAVWRGSNARRSTLGLLQQSSSSATPRSPLGDQVPQPVSVIDAAWAADMQARTDRLERQLESARNCIARLMRSDRRTRRWVRTRAATVIQRSWKKSGARTSVVPPATPPPPAVPAQSASRAPMLASSSGYGPPPVPGPLFTTPTLSQQPSFDPDASGLSELEHTFLERVSSVGRRQHQHHPNQRSSAQRRRLSTSAAAAASASRGSVGMTGDTLMALASPTRRAGKTSSTADAGALEIEDLTMVDGLLLMGATGEDSGEDDHDQQPPAVSLDDFNYLRAEVEHLRETLERMTHQNPQ
ncbi:hypothetical protein BC828DRAFT_416964 [Blastocladiella britannica]|nr:hypothetical protein BC828DRAFT_416964 [Blastocladiella britannica]